MLKHGKYRIGYVARHVAARGESQAGENCAEEKGEPK
jgi:hypothetical protein